MSNRYNVTQKMLILARHGTYTVLNYDPGQNSLSLFLTEFLICFALHTEGIKIKFIDFSLFKKKITSILSINSCFEKIIIEYMYIHQAFCIILVNCLSTRQKVLFTVLHCIIGYTFGDDCNDDHGQVECQCGGKISLSLRLLYCFRT